MKILIVYTPRSKSTWLITVLARRFRLDNWLELLTRSRRKNQSFDQFPTLIQQINTTDNICVKVTGGNDFIDLKTRSIINAYRDIDYNSFDRVILLSRNDYVSAVMSYAYMDQRNDRTWHRRRGENKVGQAYTVSSSKIYYLLRGYVVYKHVRDYILQHTDPARILEYEFESIETQAQQDFGLSANDFEIDLVNNNLNYRELAVNADSAVAEIQQVYQRMSQLTLQDIQDPSSFFWNYADQAIL